MEIARLADVLEHFFSREAPLRAGDGLVAAFSGGPDSTALLWGLIRLTRRRGVRLLAAHLDHGLDCGSAERARAAARLAAELGTPFTSERREVGTLRRPGESLEAAARRVRYAFLEQIRRCSGSRWVATAHHLDDQAETVLLRIRFGSGPEGLAGIQRRWGSVVRPVLELSRRELAAVVRGLGLKAVADPTNLDPAVPRNLLRQRILPALQAEDPELAKRLADLAALAARARRQLRERLVSHLDPRLTEGGMTVGLRGLLELPPELRSAAVAELQRLAGPPLPAGRRARQELLRQLAAAGSQRVGCDCGGGWRWESHGDRLALVRRGSGSPPPPVFAYTFEAPGEVVMEKLHLRARLTRGRVAPWMFRGSLTRAGLALPLEPGDQVVIRNRRPGDRLWPLGSAGSRRLKEILIDHRVPRRQRDCLPLWVIGDRIAWVPGVTIDDRFRLGGEGRAWIAELEAI